MMCMLPGKQRDTLWPPLFLLSPPPHSSCQRREGVLSSLCLCYSAFREGGSWGKVPLPMPTGKERGSLPSFLPSTPTVLPAEKRRGCFCSSASASTMQVAKWWRWCQKCPFPFFAHITQWSRRGGRGKGPLCMAAIPLPPLPLVPAIGRDTGDFVRN